jgi:hypothetical protein
MIIVITTPRSIVKIRIYKTIIPSKAIMIRMPIRVHSPIVTAPHSPVSITPIVI